MRRTGKFLTKLWNDESGISSVEYALNAVENEMTDTANCIEGTATC
jgi:hypothetical protein